MPKAYDYIYKPPELLMHDPLYVFENYERVTFAKQEEEDLGRRRGKPGGTSV